VPRTTSYTATEEDIVKGLILDSRELFSREKFEQRIDLELAVLVQRFNKEKNIDGNLVRSVIGSFISSVSSILAELEDAKRKAVQVQFRKINSIKALLDKVVAMPNKNLKKELENLGRSLELNILGLSRSYWRREARLAKSKTPFGYVLKKSGQADILIMRLQKKLSKSINRR